MKIRNPNIEIRNKFQIRMSQIPDGHLRHWNLEFRICFGFRASNLGF